MNYKSRINYLNNSAKKELIFRGNKYLKLIPLILGILIPALLLALVSRIKKDAAVAEILTRTISRSIVFVAGHISSVFPFSVFEFLVLSAIAFAVFLIIFAIKKLKKRQFDIVLKGVCIILIVVVSVVCVYNLAAGFAYYRRNIALPIYGVDYAEKYDEDGIESISDAFFADFEYLSEKLERDENGIVIPPYSFNELCGIIQEEYKRLGSDYFFGYSPKPKPILNSWFMTSTGIIGVAFLPTGEINLNTMTPSTYMPVLIAHEMAHTKGVMREGDANLTAYYLLISSENEYLRYCGYMESFDYLIKAALIGTNNYSNNDAWNELFNRYPAKADAEHSVLWDEYYSFKSPVTILSDFLASAGNYINDLYLRLNGRASGVGDYYIPTEYVDSGEKDPETEEPIYVPVYSAAHKIYLSVYDLEPSWLKY